MYLVYLTLAWFMCWVAHSLYIKKHPVGLRLLDMGDFITAIYFQPHVYIVVLFLLLISVVVILRSISQSIMKIVHHRDMIKYIGLIQFLYSCFLVVQGYNYFSILFILLFIFLSIAYLYLMIKKQKRSI